ncbi:MAG: anthranilate phosphoribosyltransferase, partial [Bacteroidota bacterium]
MKKVLETIYAQRVLSRETAYKVMLAMGRGDVAEAQIAALVSALNMRPLQLQELAGFRQAMLELSTAIDLEGRTTVDIVGTGGDG